MITVAGPMPGPNERQIYQAKKSASSDLGLHTPLSCDPTLRPRKQLTLQSSP